MPEAKQNYINDDFIKKFVEANILNTVDGKLIKTKFDKIKVEVKSPYRVIQYCITVLKDTDKDFKLKVTVPLYSSSYANQLRYLMGATMKILEELSLAETKQESIIQVVK